MELYFSHNRVRMKPSKSNKQHIKPSKSNKQYIKPSESAKLNTKPAKLNYTWSLQAPILIETNEALKVEEQRCIKP